MGTRNDSDERNRDTVHQISVPRYPVRRVSRRLGASTHSPFKTMTLFEQPGSKPNNIDPKAVGFGASVFG